MEAPTLSANQQREDPLRGFRLPRALWDRLKREAHDERRSATGQLIVILQERYADEPGTAEG